MYVRSCKHFLDWVIFQEGTDWPTVIFTPSNMVDDENAPNVPIEVRDHTSDLTRWRILDGPNELHYR